MVLEEIRRACRIVESGGDVEEAVKIVRRAAYKVCGKLLGDESGELSLTEMSYRLEEKGIIDEELTSFLSELDRMLEMSHYDIWTMYTREEFVKRLRTLERLAEKASD